MRWFVEAFVAMSGPRVRCNVELVLVLVSLQYWLVVDDGVFVDNSALRLPLQRVLVGLRTAPAVANIPSAGDGGGKSVVVTLRVSIPYDRFRRCLCCFTHM